MNEGLILGVPNGSLFKPTSKFLAKIGIDIEENERKFFIDLGDGMLFIKKIIILRPQAMPFAIKRGVIDCGICGFDCLKESGLQNELVKIVELNYSKVTNSPVRIVIFGKRDYVIDTENTAVYTEYPNIAREYFKNARIDFAHGSTEVLVLEGLYDYGISVVETGRTLKRNGLNIVQELFLSPTIFLARESCEELVIFGEILKGAIEAEKFLVLEMNAPKDKRADIVEILPALESPTVSLLADGNFSIKTVVLKERVVELTIQLKKLGATGIFSTDINFVV